jgi:hypothetical protein
MFKKISENQSGFKADCSTINKAFILKSIVDRMLRNKRRKLYVAFVDFQKCFDTINRQLLWDILKQKGIKGNLYKSLQGMYEGVKAYIRCNGSRTDYVNSTVGLKQGCLASPILFCFFY